MTFSKTDFKNNGIRESNMQTQNKKKLLIHSFKYKHKDQSI